jgi:hypothetical protein
MFEKSRLRFSRISDFNYAPARPNQGFVGLLAFAHFESFSDGAFSKFFEVLRSSSKLFEGLRSSSKLLLLVSWLIDLMSISFWLRVYAHRVHPLLKYALLMCHFHGKYTE